MKRLILIIFLFGIILNNYGQKISALPAGSGLASGDLFVIVQSGTTKQLDYLYLGNVLNDTADVLRAELPPLWRSDISDTADVLRVEIAAASTIDTAWARYNTNVILKFINDSVGVGTTTPTSKFEVNGEIKALSLFPDNGYTNILIGENTGAALTSNDNYNMFIGKNSGSNAGAASETDNNMGIGYSSLSSLTSGLNNFAAGIFEGSAITTGSYNTLLNSWNSTITTGEYNLFGGYLAGYLCSTSSTDNVFLGAYAGYDADVNYGVAVGRDALYHYDQAGGVGIGFRSAYNATSSVGMTAVGFESALALTTSDYHSVFGYQALSSLQTSDGSSVFGYQAGSAATGAAGLSAFGYSAGAALTTSDYHSVFGYQALDAAQTSDGSSVFGYRAGSAATGAADLSLYGYLSGELQTTADRSSYFGSNSGRQITTGSDCSLFGAYSGEDLTDESIVTFMGSLSGADAVDCSGSVAIGAQAGQSMTGVDNVVIGNLAGRYAVTNSVIIGDNAQNSNAVSGVVILGNEVGISNTKDNVLMIDNSDDSTPLIWGDFAADSVIIYGDLRVTGYAGGATAWTDESDRRLKKNISPIKNGLDIVRGLEGVRFEWIDGHETGTKVGFIAQDVEKVLPEVVYPGEPYAMQTSQIAAVLVQGMKEQQKQIRILLAVVCLLGICVVTLFFRQRKTLRNE